MSEEAAMSKNLRAVLEAELATLASIEGFDCAHAERVLAMSPTSIVCTTERDADGVSYEVIARGGDCGLGDQAYEQGENDVGVWHRVVSFGSHASARTGGHLFRQAAKDQQTIAELLAAMIL